MGADLLVIGLGNPGPDYEGTRHNVGFEVIDLLIDRHGGRLRTGREQSAHDEVRIGSARVGLAKPLTYMNESGRAGQLLVKRYDIEDPANIVIVHDELDLPVGRLKVKLGGGLAGHNGLRSLRAHLHTVDFVRIRIGVDKPPSAEAGKNHVLRKPSKVERAELDICVADAADAVEMILSDGVDAAMARYNRSSEDQPG